MLSQCARCGGLYETDPIRPVGFGGAACKCTAPLKQPTAQSQYREPTIEDAWALCEELCHAGIDYSDAISSIDKVTLVALKQLNFVRKVQP